MKGKRKIFIVFISVVVSLLSLYIIFGKNEDGKLKLDFSEKEIVEDNSLNKIIERGKLVVLTENSTVSYFVYRGQKMGFEYEVLNQFAKELGVKLEFRVVKNLDKVIDELNAGKGDLIACNYTITRDRRELINFSIPHLRSSQVLVQRKPEGWQKMSAKELKSHLIDDPIELARKNVHVWGESSYYKRLISLMDEIGDTIYIHPEPGNIETEELIQRVSDGEIDYTVVDKNVAIINKRFFDNIDVNVELSIKQQIAFGVRKGDDKLLQYLDEWLEKFMKQRLYSFLKHKYFDVSHHTRKAQDKYSSLGGGKISPFDDIIKREAEKIQWDWRLVAALIYQESKFNPYIESWQGSYGLMQFMPTTGERFGVYPDSPPEVQIRGGVKYLNRLFNNFKDVPDSIQRMKFAIASYNAGLGHILDAQNIARNDKANHLQWDNAVEDYLLKLTEPEYFNQKDVKSGYYRGNMTYRYVREVFRRYNEYKTTFQ